MHLVVRELFFLEKGVGVPAFVCACFFSLLFSAFFLLFPAFTRDRRRRIIGETEHRFDALDHPSGADVASRKGQSLDKSRSSKYNPL